MHVHLFSVFVNVGASASLVKYGSWKPKFWPLDDCCWILNEQNMQVNKLVVFSPVPQGLALAEIQQELSLVVLPFSSPLSVSPAAWDGGPGPAAYLEPSSPYS